jgi:hypothetical protein
MIARSKYNAVHSLVLFAAAKGPGVVVKICSGEATRSILNNAKANAGGKTMGCTKSDNSRISGFSTARQVPHRN